MFLYLEALFYANSGNMLCFYSNEKVPRKSKSLHFISNALIRAVRLQCRTSHKQKNKRIYHNKLKSFCVVCNYNNFFKYFKYHISSSSIIYYFDTGLFLTYFFIHHLFPNLLNLVNLLKIGFSHNNFK